MSASEQKPKIALEDLLRIKRAERPAAEFWPRFEEELRAKQLAALVQPPRPWWRGLASRRLLVRVYAPLGAAAAVAFTFSVMQRPTVTQVAQAMPETAAVVQPGPAPTDSPAAVSREMSRSELVATAAAPQVAVLHETRHLANAESIAPASTTTTPEQFLQAGTATVKAASLVLAEMVGLGELSLQEDETVANAPTEPLSEVATPRDSRRARLLALQVAYDPHAPGSKDSARSRERITRRISDESIYDQISRLGVSGDRVSIKF